MCENRDLQERLREQHADKLRRPLLPLSEARANREQVDFDDLPTPPFTGTRISEPELAELVPYIDWQFFFYAWELKGKFPAILEHPGRRELYDDAIAMLERDRPRRLAAGPRRLRVLAGARRRRRRRRRRDAVQLPAPAGRLRTATRPNRCLADYVAPAGDSRRRVRGRDPRRRRARRRLRGRARRLQGDHRQGARRPARRGVRRMAAPAGAARVVRPGRAAHRGRPDLRAVPRRSGRRSATRRAPITARRASSSTCSGRGRSGSS